jgi:hypothetical protein
MKTSFVLTSYSTSQPSTKPIGHGKARSNFKRRLGLGPAQTIETAAIGSPTKLLSLAYERAPQQQTNQAHPTAASPSQEKQNRNFPQTPVCLTTRRFDDIARDRKIACLNFHTHGLLALVDVRHRGIEYRAVATAAIEVVIEQRK